jgi:hypothetical protein
MIVVKQMECRLAGETEVLGENLPQRHFCPSQNPTWSNPGLNPGRRDGKPATNRLSYGAALAHALGRAATVIGSLQFCLLQYLFLRAEARRRLSFLFPFAAFREQCGNTK